MPLICGEQPIDGELFSLNFFGEEIQAVLDTLEEGQYRKCHLQRVYMKMWCYIAFTNLCDE